MRALLPPFIRRALYPHFCNFSGIIPSCCLYTNMKSSILLLLVSLPLILLVNPVDASARSEVVERILRKVVPYVDDTTTAIQKLDREVVEKAVKRYGQNAESLFDEGGYALIKAAKDHGPEVITLAKKVPNATRSIAADPSRFLNLYRQLGSEAVSVEARSFGLLSRKPGLLSKKWIRKLNSIEEPDFSEIASLLEKADSPATARRLISLYHTEGPSILAKVAQHKTKIIVGGVLTAAIIDGATDGALVKSLLNQLPSSVFALIGFIFNLLSWELLTLLAVILMTLYHPLWPLYLVRLCSKRLRPVYKFLIRHRTIRTD